MDKMFYHITNKSAKSVPGMENICSESDLELKKEGDKIIYLINIHLDWNGGTLGRDYGFDVARSLRISKKSLAPFIFYSPISKAYFERKGERNIKYRILYGRGSSFLEMPFTEAILYELANMLTPLNATSLYDVVTMLCDVRGIVIDKINHDLRFNGYMRETVQEISSYLSPQQKASVQIEQFEAAVIKCKLENKVAIFDALKQQFITTCLRELSVTGQEAYSQRSQKKFKILLLEDSKEDLDFAEKNFLPEFEVLTTTSANVALQLLDNDIENKILAVISDWRLLDAENKNYWQSLQGYEILEYATKSGIRSLFTLTSQADFVVHQLRNLINIHFYLIKKENLKTESEWRLFKDILYQACLDVENTLVNQPTSKQWKNTLRKGKDCGISFSDIYAKKRYLDDYFFQQIEESSRSIWNSYLAGRTIRYQLGELSTSTVTESVLSDVLIQRRLWIALFLSNINSFHIYEIMSKDPRKSVTEADVNQLKTKLCITENDIRAKKFLPEEKAWLISASLF